MRLMMRSLLADRFMLTLHREQKEIAVFHMVAAKNAATKLKPRKAVPDGESGMRILGPGVKVSFTSQPLSDLAGFLSTLTAVGRPVLDRSGLTGLYSFNLDLNEAVKPGTEDRPSVSTVLQEQLGLKLEARRSPVEVLVIDRVERPSAKLSAKPRRAHPSWVQGGFPFESWASRDSGPGTRRVFDFGTNAAADNVRSGLGEGQQADGGRQPPGARGFPAGQPDHGQRAVHEADAVGVSSAGLPDHGTGLDQRRAVRRRGQGGDPGAGNRAANHVARAARGAVQTDTAPADEGDAGLCGDGREGRAQAEGIHHRGAHGRQTDRHVPGHRR